MNPMNRRSFLHRSALATAAVNVLPSNGFAAQADDKLKLGLIGCGWYGLVDVEAAFKVGGVELIALCDVDSAHLDESAAKVERLQGTRPKTFTNFEELQWSTARRILSGGGDPHNANSAGRHAHRPHSGLQIVRNHPRKCI